MTDQELDAEIGLSGARQMAEEALLAILRDPEGPLKLSIVHKDGTWGVTLDVPGDGAGAAFAHGQCFAEAWHHLRPWWANQSNDNQGSK